VDGVERPLDPVAHVTQLRRQPKPFLKSGQRRGVPQVCVGGRAILEDRRDRTRIRIEPSLRGHSRARAAGWSFLSRWCELGTEGRSATRLLVTLPLRIHRRQRPAKRRQRMPTITTTDGTEIFYKDWGSGQPIVFSHGWPLSADDWDTQMLFFLQHGYRVIAHDRRGHGRSTQTGDGHDMDHYADDLAALTAHLDLQDAVHVGHSTGGGEVVHYIARHGESRVAKAVLISAVPPLMVQTDANPGGLPKSVFDDLQTQLAANRSEFYRALPSGPFYGYNRPGAEPSEAIIENWWRQGMMGGAKAHYDGIVAFSQTDFTEDLKKITVPVLVMHGDDDQIVPYADSGPLSAELVQNGTLKTYEGFPHGMPTTEAETINADLLAFLQS
jgi:non-heme chloroperoxidase